VASPLGRATALSCIPPTVAVHIINPLERARKKLILTSGFHLVFLVTPPHTAIEPAWDQYEGILSTLCRELKGVGEILEYLGVRMEQLMHYKRFPPAYQSADDEVRFYRRLYSAIVLFKLTEEMPLNSVGRLMTVDSGQIQTLQKESATFCAMTTVFCRKLNWDLLASCLETYVSRLGFGVREDLLPLVRLGNEVRMYCVH
jgi:POLQ-like helicase